MTTSVNIRTNGNYVAELKGPDGAVLAKAGPGNNAESGWVYVPHGTEATFAERDATAEELEAYKRALATAEMDKEDAART